MAFTKQPLAHWRDVLDHAHITKRVFVNNVDRQEVPIEYDYLILATGVTHSYFGHDEIEQFASGLKSLANAVAIRDKILQAFEQAEAEEDPSLHRDLLTFVLVGAGPTGVEMASAIAVLVAQYSEIGVSANRSGVNTQSAGPRPLQIVPSTRSSTGCVVMTANTGPC